MLQPHNRAVVLDALTALDQAAQDLEDSATVGLADLPDEREYFLLVSIGEAAIVFRAVITDRLRQARQLWP